MAIPHKFVQFRLEGQDIQTTETTLMVERTNGVYLFFFEPADDFWDEAEDRLTAVFWPSFGPKIEVKLESFQCAVPADALAAPFVRVGVYAKDGNKIFPTVWSSRLAVQPGTSVF